jgi:hypothetical protein
VAVEGCQGRVRGVTPAGGSHNALQEGKVVGPAKLEDTSEALIVPTKGGRGTQVLGTMKDHLTFSNTMCIGCTHRLWCACTPPQMYLETRACMQRTPGIVGFLPPLAHLCRVSWTCSSLGSSGRLTIESQRVTAREKGGGEPAKLGFTWQLGFW